MEHKRSKYLNVKAFLEINKIKIRRKAKQTRKVSIIEVMTKYIIFLSCVYEVNITECGKNPKYT